MTSNEGIRRMKLHDTPLAKETLLERAGVFGVSWTLFLRLSLAMEAICICKRARQLLERIAVDGPGAKTTPDFPQIISGPNP